MMTDDAVDLRPSIVKVSVLLREPVHRQLKIASVQRGVSIQKVMEDAAQAWIEEPSAEPENDPLALAQYRSPTPKDIRNWLAKCRKILESGHNLAVLGCTTALDAMYALSEQGRKI